MPLASFVEVAPATKAERVYHPASERMQQPESRAEEVRFELTIPFRVYRISSAAPSASQPLLRSGL